VNREGVSGRLRHLHSGIVIALVVLALDAPRRLFDRKSVLAHRADPLLGNRVGLRKRVTRGAGMLRSTASHDISIWLRYDITK
jgi:hypothetical protein